MDGLATTKDEVIGNFSRETFRQVMDTNAFGTLAVTEALLENVKASEQKKVVVITSLSGSIAQGGGGLLFCRMSKAALNMATQNLRAETKGQGVIFASIAPGLVDAEMWKQVEGAYNVPLPKPITPEESIAGMIKVIEALNALNSTKVLNYTGDNIPF